jgi:hypothetical protein
MYQSLIQSAQEAARALDVGGFKITVLASTEQTGGYELFRIAGPAGTGPGPHHHNWDESFSITSRGNTSKMFEAFDKRIAPSIIE